MNYVIAVPACTVLLVFLAVAIVVDRRNRIRRRRKRERQDVWARRDKDQHMTHCPAYLAFDEGFRIDCDLMYPHPGIAHISVWAQAKWVDEQVPT